MRLEDQVASLELCHRLKELGVKQESLWIWVQQGGSPDDWSECFLELSSSAEKRSFYIADGYCSAFTVAELGEMLPCGVSSFRMDDSTVIPFSCDWGEYHGDGNTEADARAKMLIYLIENKLTKLEAARMVEGKE